MQTMVNSSGAFSGVKTLHVFGSEAPESWIVVSGAVIRWDVALTQGSPRAPCGYEKMPGRFAGIYLLLNLHHLECMLRLFNRYRTYRVACAQLFSPASHCEVVPPLVET